MKSTTGILRVLCVMLVVLSLSTTAVSQRPERGRGRRTGGDGDRGGGERGERGGGDRGGGDRGGGPGGMRGGPGGMRGGPGMMRGGGGGMRGGGMPGGGSPGGGAMGFLSRLDRNGNGMLDPDEAQGPARMMLDRIAGPAKLDTSRPIPLGDIAAAFEKMREARSQEGFRTWEGRGGDSGRGGDGKSGSDGRSSKGNEAEPLVAGFGEPDLFDPVPGFGDLGERFAVKIVEADEKSAQRSMGRYDRNRDGILDQEEIRQARGLRGDPLETDRNRDGRLSMNELALRYALRRVEEEGNSGRSSSSRGGSSRSGGSSPGGDDRSKRMIDGTMTRYDQNHNGILEKSEWSKFRTDPSAADKNRDGKITRDELGKWLESRYGGGRRGRGGESSKKAEAGKSGGGAERWGDRKSYRVRTATERLPEGLPEWFARTDGDGDGQIMMSEYASSWSSRVADDFAQFDQNRDGTITVKECLNATEAGAVQGSPSTSVTSSEPQSRRGSSSRTMSDHGDTAATTPAAAPAVPDSPASAPAAGGAVPPKYVKYAVGLIKRYDTNKDGVLTKEEWTSMTKDYSSGDADKDGRLTPVELGAALMQR